MISHNTALAEGKGLLCKSMVNGLWRLSGRESLLEVTGVYFRGTVRAWWAPQITDIQYLHPV